MLRTSTRPAALAAAARLWGLAVCVVVAAAGLCGCRAAPQPSREAAVRQPSDFRLRRIMVDTQIRARGVQDERVLAAMEAVPRAEFVPAAQRPYAYEDRPLPIGEDQTISQPYMVALMTESLNLRGGEKVLEIGTGSGYQVALLAEIAEEVYTVERFEALSRRAEEVLRSLGYTNVHFRVGDGSEGWVEFSPYDGIIVTAGSPGVPRPLKGQLSEGGRLVIPAGSYYSQSLLVIRKAGGRFSEKNVCGCVFVPMIGRYGWND